jgi:hypothetical protein
MAARTRKTTLSDSWKSKIQASQVMNRLMKHFEGEVELSNTQLKAADIILKKMVPDLARTEMQQLDENGKASKPTLDISITHVAAK